MIPGGISVSIRVVALIMIIQGLAGCSINFESANAIDRQRLADIHIGDSREDVERILGKPGEYGIGFENGQDYVVAGYVSYSGAASISGIEMNFEGAIAFYQDDRLVEFRRESGSKAKVAAYSAFAKKLKGKLVLGKTNINAITELIGEPPLSSHLSGNREASMLFGWPVSTNYGLGSHVDLGFDESGVLSTFAVYADNEPEMAYRFAGEFTPSLKLADFRRMLSISHKTKKANDDAVRSLLGTKPENISSVIKVLGKPSAIGIGKSVGYPAPLLVSFWDTRQIDEKLKGSLLEIAHDAEGGIKKITWIPYK